MESKAALGTSIIEMKWYDYGGFLNDQQLNTSMI